MLVLIVGLLVLYIGNFLGIVLLSYSIPSLEAMRHYAWTVPILRVIFFFYLMFAPHEHKLRLIGDYIFGLKQKNVVFAECLANVLEEGREKRPQTLPQSAHLRMSWIVFSSVCKMILVI